jgi:hypothetical protein
VCTQQKEIEQLREYKDKYLELSEDFSDMKKNYERKIEALQDKLENVAIRASQKPSIANTYNRTNVNAIIEKLDVTTDAYINEQVQYLTIEHIKQGPKGYSDFAVNFPLKNRILCIDYARRKIQFKNGNGEIITDPEMNILAQKFFESIESRNTQLAIQYGSDLPEDTDPEQRMRIITDMAEKITSVRAGASGQKNDLVHDVIRGVCGKTII